MIEVFADPSGLAASFVAKDHAHAEASRLVRFWEKAGTRVVTTNYVLSELAALMDSPLRLPRPRIVQFIEAIQSAPWIEVIHVNEALDHEGWALFKGWPDKSWSHVDCVSFALMSHRGITEALTGDHHFEQAGFTRLLA